MVADLVHTLGEGDDILALANNIRARSYSPSSCSILAPANNSSSLLGLATKASSKIVLAPSTSFLSFHASFAAINHKRTSFGLVSTARRSTAATLSELVKEMEEEEAEEEEEEVEEETAALAVVSVVVVVVAVSAVSAMMVDGITFLSYVA